MQQYTEKDILRLAKRINNKKRSYLLVDPLQAKHIPVSPSAALQMMACLGQKVSELYSEAKLVIGFAETATSVGAVVARLLSDDCNYIHTTRESLSEVNRYIYFSEEHSHATEQKLVADKLELLFRETETIVFVDDEFSTGKTLINMIIRLKEMFPILKEKRMVAASIINRLSDENTERWISQGIESVCLLKLPTVDYTNNVADITVKPATKYETEVPSKIIRSSVITHNLPDPRMGVNISDYYELCTGLTSAFQNECNYHDKNILLLGTEECMLPALLIGEAIEHRGIAKSVKCHATTRSPIGICTLPDYPIQSGFQVHSFYDLERETYIYNVAKYDLVIIVSDSKAPFGQAANDLLEVFGEMGCQEFICMVGEHSV